MDFGSLLNEAHRRMAGDVELPEELDAIRNLLLKGVIADETGSVTITPEGSFEVRPKDSSYYLRGSAGVDPSVYVGYQSKRPEFKGRSPEDALDEALRKYSQAY